LKFKCRTSYDLKTIEVTATEGVDGVWKEWQTNNKFITGAKVRYDEYSLFNDDNTGL
jgi:hypothetical protein